METNQYPDKIIGIDFSGAQNAGNKIWIAEGVIKSNTIHIEKCFRARDLPNSGTQLELCLNALLQYISTQDSCIIGLDFPFSIPAELITQDTWEKFVLEFPDEFAEPNTFTAHCREIGPPERKRVTERENNAPFAAYNLRLYKQTYYGIRNILNPIVKNNLGYILPMQQAQYDKPWIVEICPRSTLINLDLNLEYKGSDLIHQNNREYLIEQFENRFISTIGEEIRNIIIEDNEGDCLDSIIAMAAVFRSVKNEVFFSLDNSDVYIKEGYIYA